MNPFNYEQLDPGIRETVRFFHEHDFITCDSGDGVSKLEAGEMMDDDYSSFMDVPHVVIVAAPFALVDVADRVATVLSKVGIKLTPATPEGMDDGSQVVVEASYSPNDGHAVVVVTGLDDQKLLPALAKCGGRSGRTLQ